MMNSQPGGIELFESYEQEFKALASVLDTKIRHELGSSEGEQRKALVRSAERECEEGEEIISQLSLELNNLPRDARPPLQARLTAHKNTLSNLKRDLKRSQMQLSNANRAELFGSSNGLGVDAAISDQRSTLLSGTERLNQSSNRLASSHRLALETEQLGAGILNDLRSQRDQIINTRDTLREADSSVDTAQRTLREMARRMMMNRFMTIGIIALLVSLIILILYFKFA